MRKIVSKVLSVKTIYLFLPVLLILSVGNVAHADWNYGIGTGVGQNYAKGEQGLNTVIAGPVTFDVDLDPEDFNDLMKSAFGFI